MNVFTCTGNLGRDPELRNAGGTNVCDFSVAVRAGFGDRESTLWVKATVWGNRAQSMADKLAKGDLVSVTGELSEEEWTDRDGNARKDLALNVSDVTFLKLKAWEEGESTQSRPAESTQSRPARSAEPEPEDDIPF